MEIHEILKQVRDGSLPMEAAEELLKKLPYEDLGYAKLDHHRKERSGFGEVVYCAGKDTDHLVGIYQHFYRQDGCVLGTRATEEQYEAVREVLPQVEFDRRSGILSIEKEEKAHIGCVAVCTGGTSDIRVAEEASRTAEFFGANVERIYDVGVAGIHRLLSQQDRLRHANAIVAVAGMEGALGGVVAGLVECPVIAVPTSVGYGANFGGVSALLTMLNSCAEGIAVVNIDNGFGGGYMAAQINRLICRAKEK